MEGRGQALALILVEMGAAQRLFRCLGLRLVDPRDQHGQALAAGDQLLEPCPVGAELRPLADRGDHLQQPHRVLLGEHVVAADPLGGPDDQGGRAPGLGQSPVEQHIEGLRILAAQLGRQIVEKLGLRLAAEQAVEQSFPVRALAGELVGVAARDSILDLGHPIRSARRPLDELQGAPGRVVLDATLSLEHVGDGEGDLGPAVGVALAESGQTLAHGAGELGVAARLLAEDLELALETRALELLEHRLARFGIAVGPAEGSLGAGALGDDLAVLARRRPPRAPRLGAEQSTYRELDLGCLKRAIVAVEQSAQELARRHVLELFGGGQLEIEEMVLVERPKQLARGLEADADSADPHEFDLEAGELEVDLGDPADPFSFHLDDGAQLESHHLVQTVHLGPEPGDVVDRAVEAYELRDALEARLAFVDPLESLDDLRVGLLALRMKLTRSLHQLEAPLPVLRPDDLVVDQIEQQPRPVRLAGARKRAGDRHEVIERKRLVVETSEPLVLDRGEVGALDGLPEVA